MELFISFFAGGVICVIGQLLIDLTRLTPAKILVGYVVSGVFLSAVGLYDRFIDFAGAGATVPLSGFGHALAEGVRKNVDQNGFIGIFTGGLGATAAGICAAMISALIVMLIFRPKDKS